MKITKNQYYQSIQSKAALQNAVESLLQLSQKDFNSPDSIFHINSALTTLQLEVDTHRKIIHSGDEQKNKLNASSIMSIASEQIRALNDKLEVNSKEIDRRKWMYDRKRKGAVENHTSLEHYWPLVQPVTEADHQEIAEERAALQTEKSKIEQFIQTWPFPNFSLLRGTQLEHLSEQEIA